MTENNEKTEQPENENRQTNTQGEQASANAYHRKLSDPYWFYHRR